MKKRKDALTIITILSVALIWANCGGGEETTEERANTASTVTITGTLSITAALNLAKGASKATTDPSDYKMLAISGALDSAGTELEQDFVEGTVNADGTFTIQDLSDGATAIAIIDASSNKNTLVGMIKFGDDGVIDTTSTSAGDTIDLGTVTYDGNTGFAVSSNDSALDDIKDTTTTVQETEIINSFGSTATTAAGSGSDSDGDGTEDEKDFDRDGDGIADVLDRDTDGNGMLNQIEGHKFSTCKYLEPMIFINNKVPIGQTNTTQFVLTVEAHMTDETITPTSISITAPAYLSNDTTIEGGAGICTGEGRPFDGELFDNFDESGMFCGFISGGDDASFADNANSGDMYTFVLTGTDANGGTVTETCTTQLGYVFKEIPTDITIEGQVATPGPHTASADGIVELTWTEAVLPSGVHYRYDVTGYNNNGGVCQSGEMKITDDLTTSKSGSTVSTTIDLNDLSDDQGDSKFPKSPWGCWQFDITIVDDMGDNSSQSTLKVCEEGADWGPCGQ